MEKILKNAQMAVMLNQLRPILSRRDKMGYIAARNFRTLSESLTEYEAFRNALVMKYGEEIEDGEGRSITGVKVDSPAFELFCAELAPFNEMEHKVDLMTGKYDDAIGCLTGEEILNIDWMLED